MAGISTKGMYGLAAMHYLYNQDPSTSVQIASIAQNAHIPQNYLEQILLELRKKGFLKSIRGAKGGYILTDEGKNCSVLEIIEALEGAMCDLDCKTQSETLSLFWQTSTAKIREVFNIKLSDLNSEQFQSPLHYSI